MVLYSLAPPRSPTASLVPSQRKRPSVPGWPDTWEGDVLVFSVVPSSDIWLCESSDFVRRHNPSLCFPKRFLGIIVLACYCPSWTPRLNPRFHRWKVASQGSNCLIWMHLMFSFYGHLCFPVKPLIIAWSWKIPWSSFCEGMLREGRMDGEVGGTRRPERGVVKGRGTTTKTGMQR